jgi:hypothetical protein
MAQGGGGYDIGANLSVSTAATSGLQGNLSNIFGAKSVGGFKLPQWLPFAVVGALFAFAVLWLVTRK